MFDKSLVVVHHSLVRKLRHTFVRPHVERNSSPKPYYEAMGAVQLTVLAWQPAASRRASMKILPMHRRRLRADPYDGQQGAAEIVTDKAAEFGESASRQKRLPNPVLQLACLLL
jgi:hypothetical protein